MDELAQTLKQRLIEETAALEAAGGTGMITTTHLRYMCYDAGRGRIFADAFPDAPRAETYYPAAAVIAALGYSSLRTLFEDWHEALGQRVALPIYFDRMGGHYTALIPESVILTRLIGLTDEFEDACVADFLRTRRPNHGGPTP